MPAKKKIDARNVTLGLKVDQATRDIVDKAVKSGRYKSVNEYVIQAIHAFDGGTLDTDRRLTHLQLSEETGIDIELLGTLYDSAYKTWGKDRASTVAQDMGEYLETLCSKAWYPILDRTTGKESHDLWTSDRLDKMTTPVWSSKLITTPYLPLDEADIMEGWKAFKAAKTTQQTVIELDSLPETPSPVFSYPNLLPRDTHPTEYEQLLEQHLVELGLTVNRDSNKFKSNARKAIDKALGTGTVPDYLPAKAKYGVAVNTHYLETWEKLTDEEKMTQAQQYLSEVMTHA